MAESSAAMKPIISSVTYVAIEPPDQSALNPVRGALWNISLQINDGNIINQMDMCINSILLDNEGRLRWQTPTVG
jgi:hypothetical protein